MPGHITPLNINYLTTAQHFLLDWYISARNTPSIFSYLHPLGWAVCRFQTFCWFCWNQHLHHHHAEHRRVTGLRSQPIALYVVGQQQWQDEITEMIVDFRKSCTDHAPLSINGCTVERVSRTKCLGVHVSDDLTWSIYTSSLARKARQHLYFLQKLKLPPPTFNQILHEHY